MEFSSIPAISTINSLQNSHRISAAVNSGRARRPRRDADKTDVKSGFRRAEGVTPYLITFYVPHWVQTYASAFITSLPSYLPQALHTLCDKTNSPHAHFTMPGTFSFHTFERLLSRLALETFFFGTAISSSLLKI
jgi:hypothetical protein